MYLLRVHLTTSNCHFLEKRNRVVSTVAAINYYTPNPPTLKPLEPLCTYAHTYTPAWKKKEKRERNFLPTLEEFLLFPALSTHYKALFVSLSSLGFIPVLKITQVSLFSFFIYVYDYYYYIFVKVERAGVDGVERGKFSPLLFHSHPLLFCT